MWELPVMATSGRSAQGFPLRMKEFQHFQVLGITWNPTVATCWPWRANVWTGACTRNDAPWLGGSLQSGAWSADFQEGNWGWYPRQPALSASNHWQIDNTHTLDLPQKRFSVCIYFLSFSKEHVLGNQFSSVSVQLFGSPWTAALLRYKKGCKNTKL